ncbi:MAG: hypothetical protein WKF86_11065 [Acidimicrobiales bacterium]
MGFASKCRSGLGVLPSRHRRQAFQAVQDDGVAAKSLIKALEASDRFRRDNGLGRIFHPGKISYREVSPTNSLHVILGRKRISAHVDDVCPLRCNPDGTASYSWSAAASAASTASSGATWCARPSGSTTRASPVS